MTYGVTQTGFNKKTFNDIMDDIGTDLKSVEKFGPDFDFRDGTPQRNMAASFGILISNLWDVAEDVYSSAYLDSAEDISLDYAVKAGGISRNQANKATGTVTFTGTNGVIVPVGFIVSTTGGIEFVTTASGTIVAGTLDLTIQAVVGGVNGNVAASSITVIKEPLAGLTTVNNAAETINGSNREEDFETKFRYQETLAKGGGATTNSIRASLLQIANVDDALVRENTTDAPVGGVPAHSIAPVVLGGLADDIQDKLYEIKAGGNECFGSLTKNFTDDSGNTVVIGFERPTEIDCYLQVTVTQGPDFPLGGLATIQTLLVDYINNLLIGDDVVQFDLVIEIGSKVEGILALVILTSTDDITYLPQNITIGELEKAITDNAKVVVS